MLRRGREADLVVDDDVDRATGAVAAHERQVQRLGDDALTRERRVTVHGDRQDGEEVAALVDHVLLGAHDALEHWVDGLEVRRVRRQRHLGLAVAEHAEVLALGAEVVLHVAGAVRLTGVEVALELAEDLRDRLADDVREHVQAAAVRHADDDLVELVLGGLVEHRVEQRDDGLAALQREALLADVLRLQERLERLGRVQLAEDVLLHGGRRLLVRNLDALLDPAALFGLQDVHVLDADGAAVRVAQHAQDVAELHPLLAREAADGELAVEVPQRQAVAEHVQVGVAALAVVQRVRVGHQVAARAERVDQLDDARGLVDGALGDVGDPADRLVGQPQRREDVVVEAVLAQQQLVDALEELARLRALDDAVVVRGGQRDDLANAHVGQGLLAGALEVRGVLHGADADDRALTRLQPRHRVVRADRAGVGQRDRRAREVVRGQRAGARLADQVLVGLPELRERHVLAALDRRDDQRAAAVLAGQVDRQTEVHVLRRDDERLAVDLGVVPVHVRVRLQRPDHRVADDVREGDLPATRPLQVVVDDDAVVGQQLRGHGAHAGRGRNGERQLHVLRDRGGRTAQLLLLGLRALCALRDRLGLGGLLRRGLAGRRQRGRRFRLLLRLRGRLGGGGRGLAVVRGRRRHGRGRGGRGATRAGAAVLPLPPARL